MASRRRRDYLPSSIIPTLKDKPELSTLSSYIDQSPYLITLLNSSSHITFLAPTNDAFTAWKSSLGNSTPALDLVEATLSYHLLAGSWLTVDYTQKPQFAVSSLNNASYSNVTISPPGQRVEVLLGSDGNPEFLSNNKSTTTIESGGKDVVCLNGLIQIVTRMLSIPISLVNLTVQANMSFFIAILNRANFLSVNDSGLIDFVNYASFTSNMTFFVPNSAGALATFTNISAPLSAEELTALFDYHIVPNNVLYSPDLVNGTVLKTTQGDTLTITTQGSDIYVNSAKILVPDYMIVNGVIHTIDSLLDRSNKTIPPQPSNATTPAPPPPSSGLSKGGIIGIGVAVPIAVIALLIGLIFWFLRRRKASTARHELDPNQTVEELSANPAAKELHTNDPAAKELHGNDPAAKELHNTTAPQELPSPPYAGPPVELE